MIKLTATEMEFQRLLLVHVQTILDRQTHVVFQPGTRHAIVDMALQMSDKEIQKHQGLRMHFNSLVYPLHDLRGPQR